MAEPSFVYRWQVRGIRLRAALVNPRNQREAGLIGMLAGCAIALAIWGDELLPGPRAILWAAWALACLLTLGLGWVRLCGPLLLYELVRIARRGRYILVRVIYASILLLLLAALYSWWTWHLPPGQRLSPQHLSRFAETFLFTFFCAEFAAVLVLTPAYVAGTVAEEKEQHTLEFLLATDLHRREVVLGKLLARLANLALLLLVGLPVLGFTQFFGGIDPNLVLAGFGLLGLTLLSLSALSILVSIYARKARTAISLTYLAVGLYLGLGFVADQCLPDVPAVALHRFTFAWQGAAWSYTVKEALDVVNAGNLVVALKRLVQDWSNNLALTAVVPGLVLRYAVFHVAAFLLGTAWSVLRLRSATLQPIDAPPADIEAPERWWRWPSMDKNALLWKEVVIERGFHFGRITWLLVLALALAAFVPVVTSTFTFADRWTLLTNPPTTDTPADLDPAHLTGGQDPAARARQAAQQLLTTLRTDIQDWLKTIGVLVACLLLVAVAIRASVSISGERDRLTLDTLLTTPLMRDDILYSKWLASILSVRWAWLWLAAAWTIGLITNGLSAYALPLLIWAWLVYAMFAANLGLWYSMVCRTTLRATVATLLTLAGVAFGHWLLLGCLLPIFLYSSGRKEDFPDWIFLFQKYGLTPPLTLQALTFQVEDLRRGATLGSSGRISESLGILVSALAGTTCYGLAASLLWKLGCARFRVLGVAQPLHLGLFGVSHNPFLDVAAREAAVEAVPLAEPVEPGSQVPLAVPVEQELLRGAVIIEHEIEPPDEGRP